MNSGSSDEKSGKVTAIVPAHNSANCLDECLMSIAEQTTPPFETLVIDDASTDSTSQVAKRYVDSPARVRLLSRDVPGPGGYAARNLGIAESRTEWVSFLDADDLWKPNHISTIEEIISRQIDVDVIFLGYETRRNETAKSVSTGLEGLCPSDRAMDLFAQRQIIHTNGIGVRKSFVERIGPFSSDIRFKRGADSELWARMIFFSENVYFSTEVTSQYRRENSKVVSKRDNYADIHPVTDFLAREVPHPSSAMQRLSNRKTLEWLKHCPSRGTRDQLFGSLFWKELTFSDKLVALKARYFKN